MGIGLGNAMCLVTENFL